MTTVQFNFLCGFLQRRSGLQLGETKRYLVESRLVPVSTRFGLTGLPELIEELQRGQRPDLEREVVEEMTTNETFFMRDKTPFDDLRLRLLPSLLTARRIQHSLRIWSAACSSGQEAYSIAMLLHEAMPDIRQWRIEIVGTDINWKMLDRGRDATYSSMEVQRGLPPNYLPKYFSQTDKGYQVAPHLRAMVKWQQLNLLQDFSRLGTFDIIFCRNVLIYFEPLAKTDILNRLHKQLASDGALILGAAETVVGLTQAFDRHPQCASAVYSALQKPIPGGRSYPASF